MAAPTYQAEAHGTTSVTLPATQANDILILSAWIFGSTGIPGGTYSGGAWTQAKDTTFSSGSGKLTSWWSVASGNHASQTVTLASYSGMTVTVWRSAAASPIDTNTTEASAPFGPITPAAFNTTGADRVVLLATASANNGVWSAETKNGLSMTERLDANGLAVSDIGQAASGTTGAFSATCSSTTLGAHAFALKPGGALVTGSASVSGIGAISAVGRRVKVAVAAISGTGTVAAVGSRTISGAASISGTGSIIGTAKATRKAAGAISGTGTIVAVSGSLGKASISGGGTISATAIQLKAGAASISGTGTIVAVPINTVFAAASISGVGTIAVTPLRIYHEVTYMGHRIRWNSRSARAKGGKLKADVEDIPLVLRRR